MTFNIIYTPNSVKYLSFFIYSLLDYTEYSFRLVSNGCSQKERGILRQMCERHPRLSFWCFPTNTMQRHGKVLNYLQGMTQEEYFCFMDSDIFAISKLPDIKRLMKEEKLSGLFSGMPLWVKSSEYIFKKDFQQLNGTYNQYENGQCLGNTYFAIYKNADLNQLMQHYSISFEEVSVENLLPELYQAIKKVGFVATFFDTGKVLNAFLLKHHFKLANENIQQICHIGGTSYEAIYQNRKEGRTQGLKSFLLTTPLKHLLAKRQQYLFKKRYQNASKKEYQINFNQRILHKTLTRQHFLKLYLALSNNEEVPLPPILEDKEINQRVYKAHHLYIDLFHKYYPL